MSVLNLKTWISNLKSLSETERKNTSVLFDLDSTVFSTTPRTQYILREFAADTQYSFQFPEITAKLKEVEVFEKDWGIRTVLERVLTDYDEEFIRLIRDFWKARFFSNEYLKHDTAYEGAIDFVNLVYDSGVHIKYLTARDEPRMGLGTRAQIKRWGLPHDGDRVEFCLKPQADFSDTDFKVEFFKKFPTSFHQIWYFENEPTIINGIQKARPDIQIIWLNTVHSHRLHDPIDLPWIPAATEGYKF